MLVCAVLLMAGPARADRPQRRVFSVAQADAARDLAMRECKPLVMHFAYNDEQAGEEMHTFYGDDVVPPEVLEKVVVVVLSKQAFQQFAEDLGVFGYSGYRSISPFHLTPLSSTKKPKCVGFK